MNAFDYFFENTSTRNDEFLVGKESVTFSGLHMSCVSLASWIQKKVGSGNNIIILSENNLFFIKIYLAAIKSGNTCVPLDPAIEKDNFEIITGLTNPAIVFAAGEALKKLQLSNFFLVTPEDIVTIPIESGDVTASGTGPDDCAEIIFTSGSTGKPKGVMLSHKNLVANTASIVEYLKLTAEDRMLVVLPFYYCYGLSLLHTHIRAGGSIVFNNSFIFLGGVIKNLLEYNCTGFAGVPSHFQILLRKSDTFRKTGFPHLRYVTQAGGKLHPIFIDEFRLSHPGIRFIVMYGQTEATARLSWLPPQLYETKKGSIGKGIPGVTLRVVNEDGADVRPGETGEVIARGDNIMQGYYADEEGTKKAIRNGWLYTGDLGTVDKDGYIYLTARSKEIIKVRGRRISPKEVEAVILGIPEVVDCTVEGIIDEIEGEMLKATVVIKSNPERIITPELLTKHCAEHLALYKVPRLFVFSDRLTVSASGKKVKSADR